MGKRRAFIYAVKKSITCESKERREKNNRKSRRWFRKQRSTDSHSTGAENAVVVPLSHSPTEEVKLIEAENEQNRHAYSVALVTAMAAEAAVAAAQAAAEVVRLRAVVSCNNSGKTKEEVAAIKIQTAFRGYLARRALKALRGLVRLKSLIGGKPVERQASATLKSMQTLARVQSEVRLRRIRLPEENSALQLQVQHKHEKEVQKSRLSIGENWNDSTQSKEQIEAHLHYRQEAAMRRERALAYAYSHQQPRRSSTSSANQTFMDPNNPRWGWNWLERWMAARPWENEDSIDKEHVNGDRLSITSSRNSVSIHGDHTKNTHSPKARNRSRLNNQSPSTPKSRKIRPLSPTDDDANSIQSERCGRRSIGGSSSVRDDESHASSPSVPSYMASTESARAKSRLPSPLGTPEKSSGPAKKRISFSGSSPVAPRRHSAAAKADDMAMRC